MREEQNVVQKSSTSSRSRPPLLKGKPPPTWKSTAAAMVKYWSVETKQQLRTDGCAHAPKQEETEEWKRTETTMDYRRPSRLLFSAITSKTKANTSSSKSMDSTARHEHTSRWKKNETPEEVSASRLRGKAHTVTKTQCIENNEKSTIIRASWTSSRWNGVLAFGGRGRWRRRNPGKRDEGREVGGGHRSHLTFTASPFLICACNAAAPAMLLPCCVCEAVSLYIACSAVQCSAATAPPALVSF